jgi:uncharacterized protein YqeY
MTATHRPHHLAVAKGVRLREMTEEIFGRETGLGHGRGGHMHLFDPETHFSCSGIITEGPPPAVRQAFALQRRGTDRVAVTTGTTVTVTLPACIHGSSASSRTERRAGEVTTRGTMASMNTLERLTHDLTASMKARETFRTNTLRQAIAAVRAAEKSGPVARDLTEDQIQGVLGSEVKKRRESAEIYTDAGATERATTETSEADLIEAYLPAAVSEAQLDAIVAEAISATGATTMKDMGTVMKAATAAASELGRVDGKALSQRVRQALQER